MEHEARRGFFGAIASLFKEEAQYIVRPPYVIEGSTFKECLTCEAMCVNACEEKVIQRDQNGIPFVDFKTSGCSDCQKCLDACTPKVLGDATKFIQGHAKIKMINCMSHQGTICFSCKEPCLENAIVFKGMLNPIILPEKCTGCGYCISVCPSEAIEVVA